VSGCGKNGLVSVVVASYNHASFLEKRMDSLINQTYNNIEIIVIDDCSNDNSVDILKKYQSHPKVKIILREKNGGWVVVSNQGLRLSQGEYVIFANCDDDCDLLLIENLVDAMRTNPSVAICFSRSLMIDENDTVLGDDYVNREFFFKRKCKTNSFIGSNQMLSFLIHSCVIPNLSAALFRKKIFSQIGNFSSEYKVCCDWDLFFRAAYNYDFYYIALPFNKFRQHSRTIRNRTKLRDMYSEFFRLLLTQLNSTKISLFDHIKIRVRVMDLWIRYLFINPLNGLLSIKHHLNLIFKMDIFTILFTPISVFTFGASLIKRALK
jgi:glycosyltransferase involved in cell wall biosynthesis